MSDFLKLKPDGQTVEVKAANTPISALKGILKSEGMKPYNADERRIALRKRARKK